MDSKHLIIGCGSIGSRHGRNLASLGQGDLVWFDIDSARAQANAREIGGIAAGDWREHLGPQTLVYVCLPPKYAAPAAVEAAGACKALFMEKPLAADLDGARRVVEALAASGAPHFVACNYRFEPGLLAFKRALDQGRVGRPLFLQMEYGNYLPNFRPGRDYLTTYSASAEEGGGVIFDRMHEFDFLHWLFGPPAALAAFQPGRKALPISSEEVVSLAGKWPGGPSLELHLDYLSRVYRCQRRLVGEKGELNWDYAAGSCTLTEYETGAVGDLFKAGQFDVNQMYVAEMEHFLALARGEAESLCPAEEGLAILRTALAAKASLAGKGAAGGKARGRTVVLVQARLRSTRLPRKALMDLGGKPSLAWTLQRAAMAGLVDQVVLATGDDPANDPLAELAGELGFPVFRGDEDDVLGRFAAAAAEFSAQVVVRLTGDCPFIDPGLLDRMLERFHRGNMDYLSNAYPTATFPDGLDTEIFTAASLWEAHRQAGEDFQREHVTPYIWQNREGRFRLDSFQNSEDLSHLRWTLDTAEDLEYLRALAAGLGQGRDFTWLDVLRVAGTLAESGKRQQRNQSLHDQLLANLKGRLKPGSPLVLDRSLEYFERARQCVPGAAQTFSKGYTQFPFGAAPIFAESAKGVLLQDVDGNSYLDMMMALGPILLGYGDAYVDEAVRRATSRGAAFSLPHRLEVEVAERLKKHIPCAEMTRFGQNGSDATAACVRAARAFTGRELVLACGYHGWQDWYIACTTRDLGVPASTKKHIATFPYNDLKALEELLEQHRGEVALVIMEPTGVVAPGEGYLQGVRELTRKHGALLAFDEVWTGFRFGLGGAQARFGVTPDLSAFGKALGNGWPISLVCGRSDVMRLFEETFFSFTFAGGLSGLAASMAVLDRMENEPIVETMWERGKPLVAGMEALIAKHGLKGRMTILGWPIKHLVNYLDGRGNEDLALKSLAIQELAKQRVLAPGYHVVCHAHEAVDVQYLLEAYDRVMPVLREAIDNGDIAERLRGRLVQPVFRKL